MVRFYYPANLWVSGLNTDEQGMPTGNLDGHTWSDVCLCDECKQAFVKGLGTNIEAVKAL